MNYRKIEIGCQEVSPLGGYRKTFLELPLHQTESAKINNPSGLCLEMQFSGGVVVEGYRLVTEEPDRTIVQEFNLAPDVAYDLFLLMKKWDEESHACT